MIEIRVDWPRPTEKYEVFGGMTRTGLETELTLRSSNVIWQHHTTVNVITTNSAFSTYLLNRN